MSGVKPVELTRFLGWLRTWAEVEQLYDPPGSPELGPMELLAERVMTSRAHLSQVLNGRRCGRHTWRRIQKVLGETEGMSLLRLCPAWNNRGAELSAKTRRGKGAEKESVGSDVSVGSSYAKASADTSGGAA
jgi:hypothetical protein